MPTPPKNSSNQPPDDLDERVDELQLDQDEVGNQLGNVSAEDLDRFVDAVMKLRLPETK
jgi:hypothetical protein